LTQVEEEPLMTGGGGNKVVLRSRIRANKQPS
jgi:hypothetical protein